MLFLHFIFRETVLLSQDDLKVKAILGSNLRILVGEDKNFYSCPKEASPQLLFATNPHKILGYERDLSFAGTVNQSAIFWLDEPDDQDKSCGKITIKRVDEKVNIVNVATFSYTLRDYYSDYVNGSGRDIGIEVNIFNNSWIVFRNGSWPIAAINNQTGQVTHLQAVPDELQKSFEVWNNLLLNTCSSKNYLVIWDLISGKIAYKTSGSFVHCCFSTLPGAADPLVLGACLDINETGESYRYNYSIKFFKIVESELVEDHDKRIVMRDIPDLYETLRSLYKKKSSEKYPRWTTFWSEDSPWSILGLKVILNKYLALLFHVDVDDHLNIILFKLESLHAPPIVIPLEQGPELAGAYFQCENLTLEKFNSTHIIIKFSDTTRMSDSELFYIYDFAPLK